MAAFASAELFTLHGFLTALGLLVYAVGSRTLQQRRHPSAAIAWLMLMLLLPRPGCRCTCCSARQLPKAKTRAARAHAPS